MDSGIPTNQKPNAISQDEWDVITHRLIELGRTHSELRAILVTALLDPTYCAERPQIEMRRLLAALKVADLAGSTVWGKKGDKSAFDRWRAVWNLLLGILRDRLQRPLISRRDARELKLCLNQLQPWPPAKVNLDWKGIGEDLRIIEATAKEYDGFPKSPPRRGRQMSEHQRHIVAAVELLRQSGVRDPSQRVVEVLDSLGIKREAQTVLNLWSAYKKYRRRFPEREAMPHYHLKGMLSLIRPAVKEWEKKTGLRVVSPQVSEPGRP